MDRRDVYMDQPCEISLETMAICNAACTFCPYEEIERKGEKMPDELIDKLIDQMAEFDKPFNFSPFKVSDPLLDNRLIDILQKVEARTLANIRVFTNGQALTFKKAEQLHNIDKMELWISFNEHRETEYKNLMNLDYQRTIKNIDMLHASDFAHPVILTRVGKDPDFVDFCNNRWPDYRALIIKRDGWLGFTEHEREEVPDRRCDRWFELSIMANGIVSLCCMDGKGEYPIGDINTQTLKEVYNSPLWRERRELNQSRLDINPCSTCTYQEQRMPTNTKIITDALMEIAVVADGQTASASELADGLTELNQMMAVWTIDDKNIGYFPQDTGSDTCPIPIWAEQAVKTNLAVNLAAIFRVPVSPETLVRAGNGLTFVAKKCINAKLEGVDNDHMPYGAPSTRWDISTDSI